MASQPNEPQVVRLRCRRCGWLSDADPGAELRAHQALAHPDQRLDVELVVVCPGCDRQHPVTAGQLAPAMTAFAQILFPTTRTKKRPGRA